MSRVLIPGKDLRCPVTKKCAYVDEETALRYLARAWESRDWINRHGQMPRTVYRCKDCGWWHLSSKSYGQEFSEAGTPATTADPSAIVDGSVKEEA